MKFDPPKLQIPRFREGSPATKRRKSIIKYVLAGHGFLVFLPLLLWGLTALVEEIKTKPETVVVMLSNPAKAKIVNAPKLRPPKEQPRPKPKAVKKPEVKAVSKPVAKVVATPEPQKPLSSNTKKSAKVKPVNEPNIVPPKPAPKPESKADDDISDLKKSTPREVEKSVPAESEESDEIEADYISVLVSTLYQQWAVPNDELINGRKLEVLVKFTVNAAGRITSWNIVKLSTFRPLDNSIRNLMHHAQNLPKPPDGKERTYEVVFTPEAE